jgi:hypothetical protein
MAYGISRSISFPLSTTLSPLGIFLDLQDGGKTFLRNITKTSYLLPDYTELHPRRRLYSQSPTLGPIIATLQDCYEPR